MMLFAVVVASPGTIRVGFTYPNAKRAGTDMMRIRAPAILAVLLSEFISALGFIVSSPF
jgi:hypothetical protein